MKRKMILAVGVCLLWAGAVAAKDKTTWPDKKETKAQSAEQVQPAKEAKQASPQAEAKKEGPMDKMFGWMKPKNDSEKLASIQKKMTAEEGKHKKNLQQIQAKLDRAKEGKDDKAAAKYEQEIRRENENYQKKIDILKREQAKVQQRYKAEAPAEAVKEIDNKKEAKSAEVKKDAGEKKADASQAKKQDKTSKTSEQQADDDDDDDKPAKDKSATANKVKDKSKK